MSTAGPSEATEPRQVPTARSVPASARRPDWRSLLPGALLAVVVVTSTAFYLLLSRPLWFFGDDWNFLLRRGTVPEADLGLFAPHNEHWSTGPILVFRALFEAFGLRHYLPYAVPVLLAHAAAVVLLYALLVRFSIRRWAALAAATVVAFNGAGAENLLWDFQIGFVGSFALGLLALWCYDRYDTSGWRLWPTWSALVLAVAFSSVGLIMLAMSAGYAALRRGVRHGVVVAVVPAAVFLLWFAVVGRTGLSSSGVSVGETVRQLPTYLWTGLTSAWQQVSGIPGAGAVVVLALLAGLVAAGTGRALHLAWAGTLAAFLQLLLSGLARAGAGVEQAAASRYVYLVVALMAPALAVVLDAVVARLPAPRPLTAAFGALLLGLVVLTGSSAALQFRDARLELLGTLRDRVLTTAALARDGALLLNPKPEPVHHPDITADLLARDEIASALPSLRPSPQGAVDAAANLQVKVTSDPLPLPGAADVQVADAAGSGTPAPGCQAYEPTGEAPTVRMRTSASGGQISLITASPTVTTRVERNGVVSVAVPWASVPGVPQHVGASVADATVLVTPGQPGPMTVCR